MLTLEQLSKQLGETADKIEAKFMELEENKATVDDVRRVIDEQLEKDAEFLEKGQEHIDNLNTGLEETKKEIDELTAQIKTLSKGRLSSSAPGITRNYNGNFSSPREAKLFALLVMAATTLGDSKLAGRHEIATKALEAEGVDPFWVDDGGKKVMTGSSQTAGGAIVTIEQIPSIMMMLEKYGIFRADSRPVPMGAGQTLQPKISGLLTVTCPGEGGTITNTDPTLELLSMTPKTLTALTAYSMELEEDTLALLGELLAELFTRSFAYYEDLCGFLGDGTSTYFGFTGITGALRAVDGTIGNIKSLIVGSGNAYSELALADFEKVVGTLPTYADDENAKWYTHRYFFWTVMVNIALAAGSGTAQEILTGKATRQMSFLGYPERYTQVMPKAEANSQICALLANLRQGAMLGTRGGLEFATSDERYFEKGLIGVRGRDRVAINAHGTGDTSDAGPIIGLITAAS